MDIKKSGTYSMSEDKYQLIAEYNYYYSPSTLDEPEEESLEITSVSLNGMDITDFFWDFVEDEVYDLVIEHARKS